MKIERFRYFIATAKYGSITQAAKSCFLSQSALTQQIHALEKELGVQLIIRNARGIELTQTGKQLLPKAMQLVNDYDALLKSIPSGKEKAKRLTIGYTGPLEKALLQKTIPLFHQSYPHIDIQLEAYGMQAIDGAINQGMCDLVLTVSGEVNDRQLSHRQIMVRPMDVAVSIHSDLANRQSIAFEQLKSYRFVVLRPDASSKVSRKIRQWLIDLGWDLSNIIYADNIESQLLMISLNEGISLMPRGQYASQDAIKLIPLKDSLGLHHVCEAYWYPTNELSGKLVAMLSEQAKNQI